MPEADVTNEARGRKQAPRETVRRIPQATTTDGNRQPTPVAVLLFRTGDVFLLISSVVYSSVGVRLSDTGVSGYRTLECPAIGHWCVRLSDTGFTLTHYDKSIKQQHFRPKSQPPQGSLPIRTTPFMRRQIQA